MKQHKLNYFHRNELPFGGIWVSLPWVGSAVRCQCILIWISFVGSHAPYLPFSYITRSVIINGNRPCWYRNSLHVSTRLVLDSSVSGSFNLEYKFGMLHTEMSLK